MDFQVVVFYKWSVVAGAVGDRSIHKNILYNLKLYFTYWFSNSLATVTPFCDQFKKGFVGDDGQLKCGCT